MLRSAVIAAAGVLAIGASISSADPPVSPPTPPLVAPPAPPLIPPMTPAEQRMRTANGPCGLSCAPCPAPCGRRHGCVELTLEGLCSFTQDPDGPFGEATFGAGDQVAWDEIDFAGALAGRATLAVRVGPADRFELRGTHYGAWDDADATSGVFGSSPGAAGTGDVSRPVLADLSGEATCWGAELGWWHEVACSGRWRTDLGLGVRYLAFDETAHADLIALGTGPFPIARASVDGDVQNRFVGGQLMAALHHDASDRVELGVSVKGLVGSLHRNVTVTDDSIFAGGAHESTSEDDELVFGFEAEAGFRWRWTSWLSLTGGYQVLFLDGVQRAHRAMDFGQSASGAVQARQDPDDLLVHSVFLGFSLDL